MSMTVEPESFGGCMLAFVGTANGCEKKSAHSRGGVGVRSISTSTSPEYRELMPFTLGFPLRTIRVHAIGLYTSGRRMVGNGDIEAPRCDSCVSDFRARWR